MPFLFLNNHRLYKLELEIFYQYPDQKCENDHYNEFTLEISFDQTSTKAHKH